MPGPIKKLSEKFLKDPKTVEASRPATANASIDQRLLRVDARKKKDELVRLLRTEAVKTAIIFANRKTTVRDLTTSLKRSGFSAGPIHGDMEQPERLKELDRFKTGEINILVASDVAARGLDIKGVSHVFNFDVPWQPDDYIHRIGRTGRAGATGVSITLATKDDADQLAAIEKLIGTKIQLVEGTPAPREEDEAEEAAPARKPRARKERPAKAEPKPRSEPAEPKERAPRAAKPERAEKPARAQPERRPRKEEAESAEEGWNGPVPSFLSHGFGG